MALRYVSPDQRGPIIVGTGADFRALALLLARLADEADRTGRDAVQMFTRENARLWVRCEAEPRPEGDR